MPLHIHTPLIESLPLSHIIHKPVFLKMDALQPSGSFKLRGVGYACQTYAKNGAKRFISSSGGNAGLAVAYAARKLNLPAIVVVPETTTQRAVALLRQENAEVIVEGKSWQEANQKALSLVTSTDAFIHPFDNPLLWQGHASIIDEIKAEGTKPDAIVLSVGGGGLLSGVIEGLDRNGWSDIPVIAVETEGTASFHAAVKAGHTVEIEAIKGVATSLGAKRVAEHAFECTRHHTIHTELVTDKEAVDACDQFLDDHRVLVEPACGASIAVAYGNKPVLQQYKNILIIVCGGSTTTQAQLQQYKASFSEE